MTVIVRKGDQQPWEGAAEVRRIAPTLRPLRLAWEQTGLPRALPIGTSVLHSPHYSTPRHRAPGIRSIATVHDLSFFTHPEAHSAVKRHFFRRAIAAAAVGADAIICISQTTEDELRGAVSVRVPVRVIPHGVDHLLFRPDPPTPDHDALVLSRLGIRSPFVLHHGAIEPRKNIAALVAAFEHVVSSRGHGDLALVLAGRAWPGMSVPEPSRGEMHRLGFVPDGVAAALMRRAAVVAYPSMAEGFGLPVLEALACGAPVVTTGGTVMAEVAGRAATYVVGGRAADGHRDETFVSALADALLGVLEGDGPSVELRLSQAQGFTWEASAAAHASLYRAVAGG